MKRTKLELGITLILFVVVVSAFSMVIVPVRADVSFGVGRRDRWYWTRWENIVELEISHSHSTDPINSCTYSHTSAVNHEDWVMGYKSTSIQIDPTLQDLWVKVTGNCRFWQHDGSPDVLIATWVKITYTEVYTTGRSETWFAGQSQSWKILSNVYYL